MPLVLPLLVARADGRFVSGVQTHQDMINSAHIQPWYMTRAAGLCTSKEKPSSMSYVSHFVRNHYAILATQTRTRADPISPQRLRICWPSSWCCAWEVRPISGPAQPPLNRLSFIFVSLAEDRQEWNTMSSGRIYFSATICHWAAPFLSFDHWDKAFANRYSSCSEWSLE